MKTSTQFLNGAEIEFAGAEPWPRAVDGSELLDELAATFSKYLVLPEGAADALSLWTIHSYSYDCGDISPILAIWSPTNQCGKTRVEDLLGGVVSRPLSDRFDTPPH